MGRASGKYLPLIFMLALGPALPGAARGELNLQGVRLIRLARGAVKPVKPAPAASPPVDTGYYAGKAGAGRLTGSVTVVVDGEERRAEINFPRPEGGKACPGCNSSLFIKFAGQGPAPELSWAAVLCSGRQYLGYTGASLNFLGRSGAFSFRDDSLALGPSGNLLGKTHPWLLPDAGKGGAKDMNRLCSAKLPANVKEYTVKALPEAAGGFSFKYDPLKSALTVTWRKKPLEVRFPPTKERQHPKMLY